MPDKNNGELALQLMDAEALRSALKQIAYQTRDMANESRTGNSVLELVIRAYVPAERQAKVLELLHQSAEREKWLSDELQVSAKVVEGALELAKTFQKQRDAEVHRRTQAEGELDSLVSKLENGDSDDPLLEQFLQQVAEVYYDLD